MRVTEGREGYVSTYQFPLIFGRDKRIFEWFLSNQSFLPTPTECIITKIISIIMYICPQPHLVHLISTPKLINGDRGDCLIRHQYLQLYFFLYWSRGLSRCSRDHTPSRGGSALCLVVIGPFHLQKILHEVTFIYDLGGADWEWNNELFKNIIATAVTMVTTPFSM